MAYYWVNLGVSYKEVRDFKFLWAPSHTYTASGEKTVKAGWGHVPNIKKDDIIICHEDKRVIYVAQALEDAYPASRPESRTYDDWKKEGNKVDVNLIVLERPVSTDEFKHHIIERFNDQCEPKLFTVDGNATQNYMVAIPESVASIVLSSIDSDNLSLLKQPSKSSSGKKCKKKRKAIKGGVRRARSNARIGQGAFRDEVLDIWNNTCPVTKVALPELLIASHIVSWVLSDDDEKIDGYNGFPFVPNVDKLFDKGLISFANDGLLLISPHLSVATLNALGIREDTQISGLTQKHISYLEKHRNIYGF
ncbi:HNH endonuclease [Pseudoalteromonas lipolytica]|uniref:HNH endonuclease n=1 Tax=Pseudoalteromonas lipolytica TaxID=570156 RepID=UPI003A97BC21